VTHRCPGEGPTIGLSRPRRGCLRGGKTYDVPAQDLTIDMSRLPARARNRFVLGNGRQVAEIPGTPVLT